jgi:oligopeptide transport system substrate-binding protein
MLSPLPLDSIEKVKQRPDYHKAPMGGTTFFSLNLNRPPFHNESIRRAFKHAVDRATLVTNVTQMDEEIANGPVSPVLKGRRHLTAGAHDPLYSPDIARDYFAKGCAELGISPEEFPSLTYHHFTSELQRKIAVAIQSQLAEVLGVRVQLRQSDLPLYHSLLSQKSFDIAQMSWIAQYPDQMNVLERFAFLDSRRNYSSWTSTIFQNFITQAAKERDMRVRDTLLEKAEQCIIDDTPIVSLYYYSLCYLQSPHLRDVEVSPLGEVLFDKAFITTEKVFGNSG